MAINFKKIATQQVTLSDIMQNRTKLANKVGRFHISDFDIVPGSKGVYAICAVSDTEFINGGYILTKIFQAAIAECGGDIDTCRDEFRKSGGLDIETCMKVTKAGNSIMEVKVL